MRDPAAVPERALYFENRRAQRLFGMLHGATERDAHEFGVVFCHPLGWEKQDSYRAYVQFSRYLAQAGIPSFRVDGFGFGDSDGELNETSVGSLIDDVHDAVAQFQQLVECRKIVLVGARFGATIAARVAEADRGIFGLALIAPIIDGATYWKEFLRTSRLGRLTQGQSTRSTKELLDDLNSRGAVEVDAEEYSQRFVEELAAVDLLGEVRRFDGRCFLHGVQMDQYTRDQLSALATAYTQSGSSVTLSKAELGEFWSRKSRYAGYIPSELYERVLMWLREDRQ